MFQSPSQKDNASDDLGALRKQPQQKQQEAKASSSASVQELTVTPAFDIAETLFNEAQQRMFMASIKAPKYESVSFWII